jgi:hypothetical protein
VLIVSAEEKCEDFHVGHSWYKLNGENTVITFIITGCMKNTTLRKLELFPLAVEGREILPCFCFLTKS